MIKNKCILITGAAGFIGSSLTETLLKHDNLLILLDNFNDYYPGKEKQLKEILSDYSQNSDYKLVKGDLVKFTTLTNINDEVDYVFHLAAQAGVRYSINNSSAVTYNNLVSTVNVFEYSIKIPSIQKVIYASSSSVYGNPVYTPVDEKHPKNPISPYAVTKLCGEIYADLYYKEYNLPITSLRFYTVYGPRGRPDMAIRIFFNLMQQNKEILIYGDGTQKRDFTYISDIIDGLILAGEKDSATGEVFNLGGSSPIEVNELVEKMYSITKVQKKIRFIEKQKGDVDLTHSDITKARKLLGFSPKVTIDVGLKNQYQWQTSYGL
ncbi:MAG: GDP-mannose 4,6-dehydratase [Candidatus Lokiarchaeota archaeon]|nr:GDP-mannose 4,6-dehydratase [Candidatus Lokiarchaeota archaeon]